MNTNSISYSKAVEGYLLTANVRPLSQNTINEYTNTYCKFWDFLGEDPPMEEIVSHNIEAFRASRLVAKKTLLNDHVGLSALWTWAMKEGLANENDARKVPRPRPEKKAIKPYLHDDVCEMLKALTHSRSYFRPSKKEMKHKLLHADSNRAIILLLLDLGIREYSQKPRISMANGNQQFDSGTVFLVNETR